MKFLLAVVMNLLLALSIGHAQPIEGKGSSFPLALYQKWASIYQKHTGVMIEYTDSGTTMGLNAIKKGLTTFTASNRPMSEEELDKFDLLQFPVIMGGVVPVVNMANIGPGRLRLNSSVLVDIYSGKVTRWTDPAIRRLNPDIFLPAAPIIVITRQEPSGTTYLLSHYFSRVNPVWKAGPGVGSAIKFPVGVPANGFDNLMMQFFRNPNSITYVDYAVARKNRLTTVQLQNHAGNFVSPDFLSIQAAARGSLWKGGMANTTTNSPNPLAWPIASPSYVILRRNPQDPDAAANTQQALAFFEWAYGYGDQIADDMNFISMPQDIKMDVVQSLTEQLSKN
jgi:phosphate transport system substrate-binding protein